MKKPIVFQISEQIKSLRLNKGMTQELLAAKSKISLKYIQRIEGKNPPDLGIKALQKLADGLEIPLWKLFKMD